MSGPTPAAGPQTLTCAQVAALVFDFSEGELTDDQHALVAEHLSLCADCAEFVRTYSAVGRLVRHAMEVQVDPELQAELDAAIFGALAVTA
jgi:hypothetical protein